MINVTWHDAHAYLKWLAERTGVPYRLPSEAEWEYACRAGTLTNNHWGNRAPTDRDANFALTVGRTTEVGIYPANPWGLYDMHGNVGEWLRDTWHFPYTYAPNDGLPWVTEAGDTRQAIRGGTWSNDARNLRSASRLVGVPTGQGSGLGFRPAMTLS